jgi:hypothetical protein
VPGRWPISVPLTPKQEAEYSLDYGVSRADLRPEVQAEYDRLLADRRAASDPLEVAEPEDLWWTFSRRAGRLAASDPLEVPDRVDLKWWETVLPLEVTRLDKDLTRWDKDLKWWEIGWAWNKFNPKNYRTGTWPVLLVLFLLMVIILVLTWY